MLERRGRERLRRQTEFAIREIRLTNGKPRIRTRGSVNRGGCARSFAFDVSLESRKARKNEREKEGQREVVGGHNCAERLVINFKSRDTPRHSSGNFLHDSPSYLFAFNAPGRGGEEDTGRGETGEN